MRKYGAITRYLKASKKDRIRLTFKEIEKIIGDKLPPSAKTHRSWWANTKQHVQSAKGWLAAGYIVAYVDLEKGRVCFDKAELETKQTRTEAAAFEQLARKIMSKHFRTSLKPDKKKDWPKKFDMVSCDYTIAGDAKYFTMVKGHKTPPAKLAIITEHVCFLQNTDAKKKFLVFGNDIKVPLEWLKRYKNIAKDVEFYFIHNNGKLEKLYPNK